MRFERMCSCEVPSDGRRYLPDTMLRSLREVHTMLSAGVTQLLQLRSILSNANCLIFDCIAPTYEHLHWGLLVLDGDT
jgi:hypothetical protein